MKSSYITHFVGYDKDGNELFNGNGSVYIEHIDCIDPDEFRKEHNNSALKSAKKKNENVDSVLIKSIMKL